MPKPSWSVVSTVREPLPLVLAFACHHLNLGAQTVHLFFDDPNDPVADLLDTAPGVEITRCDADHWVALGCQERPMWQTRRQTLNANYIAAQQRTDWLLHVDADEFLWTPFDIEDELRQSDTWVHIRNLERVWTAPEGNIFDGSFRAPGLPEPLIQQIYGPTHHYLQRGLSGHASGKAMARLADRKFIAIHAVKEKFQGNVAPRTRATHARILHFDGMTARHWVLKTLRYAVQGPAFLKTLHSKRSLGVERLISAVDPVAEGLALHSEIFRLSEECQAKLCAEGALHTCVLQLDRAVTTYAPNVKIDFSAKAFDAEITEALDDTANTLRAMATSGV